MEDFRERKADFSYTDGSHLLSIDVDEDEPCTTQARTSTSAFFPSRDEKPLVKRYHVFGLYLTVSI